MEFKLHKNTIFLFVFPIILLFFSCTTKDKELPEGILTKEEMIPVLIDIQIAEANINIKKLKEDSIYQYAADYYDYIFEIHHISKEEFQKSYDYYLAHMNLMDEMYESVLNELIKKESEVIQQKSENK